MKNFGKFSSTVFILFFHILVLINFSDSTSESLLVQFLLDINNEDINNEDLLSSNSVGSNNNNLINDQLENIELESLPNESNDSEYEDDSNSEYESSDGENSRDNYEIMLIQRDDIDSEDKEVNKFIKFCIDEKLF